MSDGRTPTDTDLAQPAPEDAAPEREPAPAGDGASDLEAARRSSAEAADAAADDDPFGDLELEEDGMPAAADLENALRAVVDPEIGYNVVDLGLLYQVDKVGEGRVHVLMTLTSMGCPLTELIDQQCTVILSALPGVQDVEVEFTFSPPWSPDMMADYVRDELRAMGMNI